jgi:hypothetical protein
MEKVEFEFPDEAEDKNSRAGSRVVTPEADEQESKVDADDIEIVDDTPAADRNRKPMAEPPKELTEEELNKYDEGVRKRIQHFTKGYHEERRAKETAQREKEEAVRIAQAIVEENKKLKGSLSQGQAALIDQAKKVVANELETAERKYRTAYEAGDTDALMAAQREMTQATLKADRVNNFKPAPLQEEKNEVQTTQPVQTAPVDSRATAWQEQNQWFGRDEEMTSFALGLHTKLINQGVDPRSEAYYDRLNSRLKQVFPDSFESDEPVNAPTSRPKSNVVAPATRSTAPRKVVLTKSQVEIAKRLGVPLELYARKVAEEMRN